MATTRPFAYNLGSSIDGTEQLGNLAIGTPTSGFTESPKFWNGPDEDLGYVITHQTPSGQPAADGSTAYLGFWRSNTLTELSFVELSNTIAFGITTFTTGDEAKTWLNNNGYWTSWINPIPTPSPTSSQTPTTTPTQTPTPSFSPTPTFTPTSTITPTPSITASITPSATQTPTQTPTQTRTPTPTPTISFGVTFSQTFTGAASPGTTIENAWTTFRSQLTGTYTKFDFTSSNGQGYTGITDSVKVQQLADSLRTGTGGINFTTTISGVTWAVGCCACRSGGASNDAVEFANVALCSASSTAALRPFINNSNWGGIGSTVNAATQTLTLKFY